MRLQPSCMKARDTERCWGAPDKLSQSPGTADRRPLIRQALKHTGKCWYSIILRHWLTQVCSGRRRLWIGQVTILLKTEWQCFLGCYCSFLLTTCLLPHCLHTLQKQLWMPHRGWVISLTPSNVREVHERRVGKTVGAGRLKGKLNAGFWIWHRCYMH